jgi:hypothetical protein
MNTLTDTFNGLASKLGQAFGLSDTGKLAGLAINSKLLLLLALAIALPFGMLMCGVWLVTKRINNGWLKVRVGVSWFVRETVLALLLLVCVILLGVTGWMAYDNFWKEHRVLIAAGSRPSENYAMAQALKTITARHFPRTRISVLEIEAAADDTGILEKDIVQLAVVSDDSSAGQSVRSIAVLSGSVPSVLLARNDVDEKVAYALAQVTTQFSQEFMAALPPPKTEPQPLATNTSKPAVKSNSSVPLHSGAAAFYDRNKTRFVVRHVKLIVLVLAWIAFVGLSAQYLKRRKPPQKEPVAIPYSPPIEREPWTFSKILLEATNERVT